MGLTFICLAIIGVAIAWSFNPIVTTVLFMCVAYLYDVKQKH